MKTAFNHKFKPGDTAYHVFMDTKSVFVNKCPYCAIAKEINETCPKCKGIRHTTPISFYNAVKVKINRVSFSVLEWGTECAYYLALYYGTDKFLKDEINDDFFFKTRGEALRYCRKHNRMKNNKEN